MFEGERESAFSGRRDQEKFRSRTSEMADEVV